MKATWRLSLEVLEDRLTPSGTGSFQVVSGNIDAPDTGTGEQTHLPPADFSVAPKEMQHRHRIGGL
jgi:hypothetical protein